MISAIGGQLNCTAGYFVEARLRSGCLLDQSPDGPIRLGAIASDSIFE